MSSLDLRPAMVGREQELATIVAHLDEAIQGRGTFILISGEAGIGKTRLVDELKGIAQAKGVTVLSGYCAYESLTPYMPFFEALRSGGFEHLFAEDVPRVEGVYLATSTGLLVTKALRKDTGLDPDIFASMLKTVGDFVSESMTMLRGTSHTSTLDRLGSGGYTLLVERGPEASLVVVLRGRENEFLIEDMRATLREVRRRYGQVLREWNGDDSSVSGIEDQVRSLITSGKYDGVSYAAGDARVRRNLLFEHVSLGLVRLATDRPILLSLEDLQWADPSTLALAHHLARLAKTSALLLAGTYRPEDLLPRDGRSHHLVEAMQRMDCEGLYHALELRRLGEAETGHLVSSCLGGARVGGEFEQRAHRWTEGNPFFVVELLRLMVAEGLLRKEDGTWGVSEGVEAAGISSRVRDTVLRRLSRIPDQERGILDMASVLGEEFDADVLSLALGVDRVQVSKALRVLEQPHRLVRSLGGRHRFDHVRIKEVVYGELPVGLREEYHGIAGHTLVEQAGRSVDVVAGEVAFHFLRSRDPGYALPYLDVAADRAAKQFANEEAIRLYSEALTVAKDMERRRRILEALGGVYRLTGDYEGALRTYRVALESTDEPRKRAGLLARIADLLEVRGAHDACLKLCTEARALVKDQASSEESLILQVMGRTSVKRGEYEKALEYLGRSLAIREAIGDEQGVAQVLGSMGLVHADRGDYDHALDCHARSLAIFERIGDWRGLGMTSVNIGIVHKQRGDYEAALEHYRQGTVIFEKIGDRGNLAIALGDIGAVHAERGEHDMALEYLGKNLAIREAIGDQRGLGIALVNIGEVYRQGGDYAEALMYFGKGRVIREAIGDQRGVAIALGNMGTVYLERGGLDDALLHSVEALAIFERLGDRGHVAPILGNIGAVHAQLGEFEKAHEYARRGLEAAEQIGQQAQITAAQLVLAEVFLRLGDERKASDFCRAAYASAVRMNLRQYISDAQRTLGMVQTGRQMWPEAITNFQESLRISGEIGSPFLEGKARYAFGLMWKRRGEPAMAREHLAAAESIFARIGARGELARTKEALGELLVRRPDSLSSR